jgi:hypothetical protein
MESQIDRQNWTAEDDFPEYMVANHYFKYGNCWDDRHGK